MESLIQYMENWIAEDFNFLSSVSWSNRTKDMPIPDRNSSDFVEHCQTRLVMRLGFADGMAKAFEIKYYLDNMKANK